METDFPTSGNHFFLPFSDTPTTDSFIFPSNRNVFLTSSAFWLVKADSLSSASHYFIYFSDIGNVFLRQIFYYGQWKRVFWLVENSFFPFFRYSWQLKFFSAWCKFIFKTNPLFWIVETILFQFLKYPFYWKQFFDVWERYFKQILYYRQWQRIFCLMRTIFFHSYFL